MRLLVSLLCGAWHAYRIPYLYCLLELYRYLHGAPVLEYGGRSRRVVVEFSGDA
jgi:hypothetical protein